MHSAPGCKTREDKAGKYARLCAIWREFDFVPRPRGVMVSAWEINCTLWDLNITHRVEADYMCSEFEISEVVVVEGRSGRITQSESVTRRNSPNGGYHAVLTYIRVCGEKYGRCPIFHAYEASTSHPRRPPFVSGYVVPKCLLSLVVLF